jgi:hypothetical protein
VQVRQSKYGSPSKVNLFIAVYICNVRIISIYLEELFMFLQLQGGDPIPLCRKKEGERLRLSEGMEPREGACAQQEVEGGKQEKIQGM